MFKQVTITLGEASGLANLISRAVGGIDVLPFKLAHRFNRQLNKLADADKLIAEAREAALQSIIGEEKFEEIKSSDTDTQLSDVMTEGQVADFQEAFNKELESEYTASLLSEDFTSLISDEGVATEAAMALSGVVSFYEDKEVWVEA